jgi:Bacterial SH3 domain.
MMLRTLVLAAAAALSLLASADAAFAQVVEGEEHCVVNVASADALNLRERPSASSRIWTTLPYGRCGIIVTEACRGSWCPVEDGHHSGWVNSRYISMVSPALYCVSNVAAGDRLNMRAFPSGNSRILTSLARNQCGVAFLPYATGSWQKVRVGGFEGWVNRRYLSGQ